MDCSFCYRTTPQERAKSPEKLDEELNVLKSEHNIEFVFFVDLTFTSHKKQTMEILDVIKKHDIRWTCLTRCADVDRERAEAMADSGCDIALFGVESLGKEVLREARKGNTENTTIKGGLRTLVKQHRSSIGASKTYVRGPQSGDGQPNSAASDTKREEEQHSTFIPTAAPDQSPAR